MDIAEKLKQRAVKSAVETMIPLLKQNTEAIQKAGKGLLDDIELRDGEDMSCYLMINIKGRCVVCEAAIDDKEQKIVRINKVYQLEELIELIIQVVKK